MAGGDGTDGHGEAMELSNREADLVGTKVCAPKKIKSGKTTKPLWLSYRGEKLVRKKHRAYARYKDTDHPAYRKIDKKCRKEIKKAKKNFEKKLAQNIKQDKKSFYAYARNQSRSGSW